MKILYFYAEVMGYTEATFEALIDQGAELHIVNWDKKKLTPHQLRHVSTINFYDRSSFSTQELYELMRSIHPDCIVVSGWMDYGYLSAARLAMTELSIPIVCCLDSQWNGTLKQCIAAVIAKIGFFKRYFTHMWVSGTYQFEYARKLQFSKQEIIFDLYSAHLSLFHKSFYENKQEKLSAYPKRFLYVGRFEPVKNISLLLEAWEEIKLSRHGWELLFIGTGSMEKELKNIEGVSVKTFLTQAELALEVSHSGCFILPSSYEPWGVVLHEFSAAGLPIICSDVCGASTSFIIPGNNGFIFKSGQKDSLISKIQKIISLSDDELNKMSHASFSLSQRISPETSAANLLSLLR